MKISRINILNHHHLSNLLLDFTYQDGLKKGKPLEKICLIGQSGTGKTTILNIIEEIFALITVNSKIKLEVEFDIYLRNGIAKYDGNNLRYFNFGGVVKQIDVVAAINKNNRFLVYIASEVIQGTGSILQEFGIESSASYTPSFVSHEQVTKSIDDRRKRLKDILPQKVIKISSDTSKSIWEFVIQEILDFDERLKLKGAELIQKGIFLNTEKMAADLQQWKTNNPNPRIELANKCLNPLLNKFHLEVDQDDIERPITIRQVESKERVPGQLLSTGTKQIVLSLLPIYKLATEDCLICIDEPERSLFPDIQMEVIPFITQMRPSCQLIIATHSPMIAACFEPDERFIFFFDSNGDVAVKRGSAPIGDDPNDILKEDFNIASLMNDYGQRMYQKYLDIKSRIRKEENPNEKEKLIQEAAAIGDSYRF